MDKCDAIQSLTRGGTRIDELIPVKYHIRSDVLNKYGEKNFTVKAIQACNWDDQGNVTSWGVYDGNECLNRSTLVFDYDGANSSRTEQFKKTHRFATMEDAYDAYEKHLKHVERIMKKRAEKHES